jgi:small subunit ribosomal protein S1
MDLKTFVEKIKNWEIYVPNISAGEKIKWKVLKQTDRGVIVDCEEWAFTWIILPKEVKELERNGVDLSVGVSLEAELIDPDIQDEEGYYVISISKLLQYDKWQELVEAYKNDKVITVVPTEANLWGLLVDIHWIKWFLPLSQLAPVHYPRVEDWDQEKIFERLLDLIWKEFKVRIINLDEENKRMILSEREALREEREKILKDLKVWNVYDWVISGVSSYGLFVTIWWWIEGLVHISEITYWHVHDVNAFWKVWDKVKVKVIGYEDWKISLSMKQLKPDPWTIIPKKFKVWDIIEGEVVRFVPYGAFVRVYDDINWLVHLSELSDKPVNNPAEVLRLWEKVKAKIILLDPKNRRIGLSIRQVNEDKKDKKDKNWKKVINNRKK